MRSLKILLITLTVLYSSACYGEQDEEEIMTQNNLSEETSPYLLQHADNPVHWYAWGDEAFDLARSLDKPIFLSIGYSSCHWCHVMEEESFEDPEVAELLNEVFICIKVDREERPDVDAVYMRYALALSGRGGWPLSIIMTPEGKPFFAATYIPKYSSQGMAGMLDLIPAVSREWNDNRGQIDSLSLQIADLTTLSTNPTSVSGISSGAIENCYLSFESSFDSINGGFGTAPKFPSPHSILFLLRYWKNTGNNHALEIAAETMTAIRAGGIYDQLGFGLHRYSTDCRWLVPHFEKMLYDQAMFVLASVEMYQATNDAVFKEMANSTIQYVLESMTSPEGAFYSSEDADSGEGEGEFYVWTIEEIELLLNSEIAAEVIAFWGMTLEGNFTEQGQISDGKNILYVSRESLALNNSDSWLEEARPILLNARENRPRPFRDEKILTDWNGLMIASLARAALVLDRPELLDASEKAFAFITNQMAVSAYKLTHSWMGNRRGADGFLDDYAFMIRASLELYATTLNMYYLEYAISLQNELDTHFAAPGGSYYFTADYGDRMVPRIIESYDGAIPSGNSIELWNLVELWKLTGESQYHDSAIAIENSSLSSVVSSPSGYAMMLSSSLVSSSTSVEVVITGEKNNPVVREMINTLNGGYNPNRTILLVENSNQAPPWIPDNINFELPSAYVCSNGACHLPVRSASELEVLVNSQD